VTASSSEGPVSWLWQTSNNEKLKGTKKAPKKQQLAWVRANFNKLVYL